ncbi:MAG: glycosyltransferase family 39 protein [Ardenticatenaceae bacterium]|nr:glycosyltransferase family 39 protein [Anaerolineales bacterium]MCB8938551.1 glycosyltransferase family 39 protein [Ardenticatenaceae bacterium]MCB8973684.1 glycosyltransferase family 39 protein [Ardenticatenaceae bacterium]
MRRLQHSHALLFMLFCLMTAATLRLSDLPQVPPGVHYDEAANGILAAEIGLKGERPLFITSYTGKEVLFFYLAGGLIRLVGSSIFTLRLTAALVGIVTVAAVYWLGLELFRDRRVALVAAALLAISFWHLLFSHLGFRAITQPLLQTLTTAALLRGVRLNQRKWLLIGGVFLGLTGYTYLAARLFPALLLLSCLPLLFGRNWRQRWLQLLLVGGVGVVVLAPLIGFFIANPDAFWVRIEQVAPSESALTLWESLIRSLEMFFLLGDEYIRFNLPGRPLFGWFWGGLLLVGWMLLVWRWRELKEDWQRTSVLLLLLAPFIMLLPTALAVNEIVPSNLRAIGLIPFIFYLPGAGLILFISDLGKQFKRIQLTQTVLAIGVLALMLGGLLTERLYFRVWGQETAVFYETDGDLTAAAQFLDQLDTEGKNIYVSALHYQHPTLAYLSQKYEQVKWLPQSQAVVFPDGEDAIYIFPQNSPLPKWAIDYFANATLLSTPFAPDGSLSFLAYEMRGAPAITPTVPVAANFGNAITLLGYDVGQAAAGESLPLFLYWQVNFPQSADFTPFIHFEDAWGHRWSQVETFAYPSAQWERGETIVQRVEIDVPLGAPLGNNYQLRVGLFSGGSGERLPRLDDDGRYAGDTYLIQNVTVLTVKPPRDLPQPPTVLNRTVRAQLKLLGVQREALEAITGETVNLALWWHATGFVPDTTIRLELMGGNNVGRILVSNTQPVHGTYPFYSWETPQFLIDWQSLRVPNNIPSGEYRLIARFRDGAEANLAMADLGLLRVTATERNFVVPGMERPYPATFGNEIDLLGYNLTPLDESGQYQLDLIWQAQSAPSSDYTVFVHLLQADGTCAPCVWQQDVMPQQNQYPTSRWLADEVITDSYQIQIPSGTQPGSYRLEIGLYIAETGQRLQAVQPERPESNAVLLDPLGIP